MQLDPAELRMRNLLRPEQFVRARVVFGTHEGVTVPALAVQLMNGPTFVYVAEAGEGGEVDALAAVVGAGVEARAVHQGGDRGQ